MIVVKCTDDQEVVVDRIEHNQGVQAIMFNLDNRYMKQFYLSMQ